MINIDINEIMDYTMDGFTHDEIISILSCTKSALTSCIRTHNRTGDSIFKFPNCELNFNTLRKILRYNIYTGKLYWCVNIGSMAKKNSIAGSLNIKTKYYQIKINGTYYQMHRVIWFYMTGLWPIVEIDHKDRNKSNNIWNNLRDVSHADNMLNKGIISSNTSGTTGVSFDKSKNKWVATYRGIKLGTYVNKNDAIVRRLIEEDKYGTN